MNTPIRNALSKNVAEMEARAAVANKTFKFLTTLPVTVSNLSLVQTKIANKLEIKKAAPKMINNITFTYAAASSINVSGTYYILFETKPDNIAEAPSIIGKTLDNIRDYDSFPNHNKTFFNSSGIEIIAYTFPQIFSSIELTVKNHARVISNTTLPASLKLSFNVPGNYLYKFTPLVSLAGLPAITASTNPLSYELNQTYFNKSIIYYNNTSATIPMPSNFRWNNFDYSNTTYRLLPSTAILQHYVPYRNV